MSEHDIQNEDPEVTDAAVQGRARALAALKGLSDSILTCQSTKPLTNIEEFLKDLLQEIPDYETQDQPRTRLVSRTFKSFALGPFGLAAGTQLSSIPDPQRRLVCALGLTVSGLYTVFHGGKHLWEVWTRKDVFDDPNLRSTALREIQQAEKSIDALADSQIKEYFVADLEALNST